MKAFWKVLCAGLLALLLCACVPHETTDVVSFCKNTKTQQSSALRLTDCLIERENGELRCFWTFPQGIGLRLICTEDGQIAECRVVLQRMNEAGGDAPVTPERAAAFSNLAACVCGALEEVLPQQAQALLQTLDLSAVASYDESSAILHESGFSAQLLCGKAECVLRVCNRWLSSLEEKETPESVPAFDATTNIRKETVPHS